MAAPTDDHNTDEEFPQADMEDRWESTDDDYWNRIASTGGEEYDDLDDLAEAFEKQFYGQAKVKTHKKGKARFYDLEVGEIPAPASPRTATAPPPKPSVPAPVAQAVPDVPFEPLKILQLLSRMDKQFNNSNPGKVTVTPMPKSDHPCVVAGYNHMMRTLATDRYRRRYGWQANEGNEFSLTFGGDVPSYFANVGGQTIYRRKVLSIAGLRNLVVFGPQIFRQLQDTKFSGHPSAYSGDVGLNLMRRVTGNVVDLDTVVLRCNDRVTLAVINASNTHKKLPTHASASAFSSSDQARDIAVSCAEDLIKDFVKAFKLTEAQQQARRLILTADTKKNIPIASSNTERGHHPIWHYINAGQDSFHANVPTMDDVVGALLRAPFHCLQHYAFIHSGIYSGDQLQSKLDSFFEDCVVDSCFNMKWKAIEEFGRSLAHEGTIVDVLQRLQQKYQSVFTAEFFDKDDDDQTNEIKEMQRLVVAEKALGRETATGVLRAITADDVARWVKDPSVKL